MKSKKLKYTEGIGAVILISALAIGAATANMTVLAITIVVAVLFKIYLWKIYKEERLLDKFWKGTGQAALVALVVVGVLLFIDN